MGVCINCGKNVKYQSAGKVFKCDNVNKCNEYINYTNFLKKCTSIRDYYDVELKKLVDNKKCNTCLTNGLGNVLETFPSLYYKLPCELWLIINEYFHKYKEYNYSKKNLFIINKTFIKHIIKHFPYYNQKPTINYYEKNLHILNSMFLEHVKQQYKSSQFIYPKKYYKNLEKIISGARIGER